IPNQSRAMPTRLYASFLRWTASVVRHRRYVSNIAYFQTAAVQSTDGRLATWARAIDLDVQILQTVQLNRSLASALGSNLGCERRALTRATETRPTGGRPAEGITLTVGDRHDGVVERSMDERDAVHDRFAGLLLRRFRCCRLCHKLFLIQIDCLPGG